MKISILAKCQLCEKQFIFDGVAGNQALPESNFNGEKFPVGKDLVRHKYVESIEVNGRDFVDTVSTVWAVCMCRECDSRYWENFRKAVAQLESFWHGPLGGLSE
jgi:hypothetical protein